MEHTRKTATIGRREILAIGAAVAAGIAAKGVAQPVAAATIAATSFSATGTDAAGYQTSQGTFETGVSGIGSQKGVFASSGAGTGLVAFSTTGDAAVATTFGTGVSGKTAVTGRAFGEGNIGVFGSGTTGVSGEGLGGNGVFGTATVPVTTSITAGVYGTSNFTYGVLGSTMRSGFAGVGAITGAEGAAALAATSTHPNAYAAYFQGTTIVQGNFAVVGGHKSAGVKDATGQHRLVYCVESPESWFEDFGKGTLVGGKAEVKLDPIFTQIAHTDDYHVFLAEYDDHNLLYVTRRTAAGFVVQAKNGVPSGAFSYRVVAKRADIKGERLAKFDLLKINTPDESKLLKPEPPKAGPSATPPPKP